MLERLRMQEVEEIILSVPKGVIIKGTSLQENDPVMIINRPNLSMLNFKTKTSNTDDGRGFISASGLTNNLDFVVNEGSILYSVWSYLYGINEENITTTLKGTEHLVLNQDNKLLLGAHTEITNLSVYKEDGNYIKLKPVIDYTAHYEIEEGVKNYYIEILNPDNVSTFFVVYNYTIDNVALTTVKQVHNNIFCTLDIYFDAVDMDTDEHHKVCIHSDKVQVFTDLAININSSNKASFTPIQICSIPEQNNNGELNKDVAKIMVI